MLKDKVEPRIDRVTAGQECNGTGGFSDIRENAAVTVRNEKDELIANGRLGPGEAVEVFAHEDEDETVHWCEFSFRILNVPKARFYAVEVSQRGEVVTSHDELEAEGRQLSLSVG